VQRLASLAGHFTDAVLMAKPSRTTSAGQTQVTPAFVRSTFRPGNTQGLPCPLMLRPVC